MDVSRRVIFPLLFSFPPFQNRLGRQTPTARRSPTYLHALSGSPASDIVVFFLSSIRDIPRFAQNRDFFFFVTSAVSLGQKNDACSLFFYRSFSFFRLYSFLAARVTCGDLFPSDKGSLFFSGSIQTPFFMSVFPLQEFFPSFPAI